MTSSVKFNRQINVRFNDEKVISGLRVIFRVDRVIGDAYATMKLDIYNMVLTKEGESEAVFKAGDKVSVDAGYEGNISTIFTGTIRNSQVIKTATETITTIFSSDLNSSGLQPVVNVSYRNQTSLVDLISDVAFEAGIDIAEISIKPNNLIGSVTYSKSFSRIMDDLSETYNFTWYIFNFELYLYDKDAANSGKEALTISAATGLLETPVLTGKGIDIKMLLEPSVRPRDLYNVIAGGLTLGQSGLETTQIVDQGIGVQKVLSVAHTGDTHNTTWFTEIEGERVSA